MMYRVSRNFVLFWSGGRNTTTSSPCLCAEIDECTECSIHLDWRSFYFMIASISHHTQRRTPLLRQMSKRTLLFGGAWTFTWNDPSSNYLKSPIVWTHWSSELKSSRLMMRLLEISAALVINLAQSGSITSLSNADFRLMSHSNPQAPNFKVA